MAPAQLSFKTRGGGLGGVAYKDWSRLPPPPGGGGGVSKVFQGKLWYPTDASKENTGKATFALMRCQCDWDCPSIAQCHRYHRTNGVTHPPPLLQSPLLARDGLPGGGGGGDQGLGIRLFAFGSAYFPLATAHSDPLWVRTCFGCVNGASG